MGNKIANQEEALAALNNLLDHGIVSDDIVEGASDYESDFDELIQSGLELKLNGSDDESEKDIHSEADAVAISNKVCECKSDQETCGIMGISINHISSGCFNLLKISDGIKDITFDLDLVDRKGDIIDEDKVCGYAMAFLGFILPAFHPQRIGSKTYSGKYSEAARSVTDFNSDKFKFYELSDLLLGYYVPEKSLNEFTNLCIELNSQGLLVDLFERVSETLLSDGFNYIQLGDKIGVMGTLKTFVDMSERFMETFINDKETVVDMDNPLEKMYDAVSRVSVLPALYYEEIDSFFTLFDCEGEEDMDDEGDEDDIVNKYSLFKRDDEAEDNDDITDKSMNVVQHMTEMMNYVISSDDKSKEDDSDGLLDDVEGAEEVKVDIKPTEDKGVEANVSVSKSEPIVIDSDTDFVVRRR